MITYNLTINNMWTEQETKRYEEHLEKHWTRKGKRKKYDPLCEQYQAQIKAMEYSDWQLMVGLQPPLHIDSTF